MDVSVVAILCRLRGIPSMCCASAAPAAELTSLKPHPPHSVDFQSAKFKTRYVKDGGPDVQWNESFTSDVTGFV